MFEQEPRPEAYLSRWFVASGFVGVVTAGALTILLAHDRVSTGLAIALWPSSIGAIGEPGTFVEKLLTAIFTFGGQFALYACAGWLIGYGTFLIRLFFARRSSA
jgi:hypothetical protein